MATTKYMGVTLPAGLSHAEINAEMARIRAEARAKRIAAATELIEARAVEYPHCFIILSDTGWRTSREGRCYTVQTREVVFAAGATHAEIQHWAEAENVGFAGQEYTFSIMGLVQGGDITLRMRRATDSGD